MWLVTEYQKLGSLNCFLEKYRLKQLKKRFKREGKSHTELEINECVPLHLIVKLAADVALGVMHLHQENVIHRGKFSYPQNNNVYYMLLKSFVTKDIAARNVLVARSHKSKYKSMIIDFGLSRVKSGLSSTTISSVGPVKWMAPGNTCCFPSYIHAHLWHSINFRQLLLYLSLVCSVILNPHS